MVANPVCVCLCVCVCVCVGMVGLVWFVLWSLLVFNSPDRHPRISDRERTYICSSLENEVRLSPSLSLSLSLLVLTASGPDGLWS